MWMRKGFEHFCFPLPDGYTVSRDCFVRFPRHRHHRLTMVSTDAGHCWTVAGRRLSAFYETQTICRKNLRKSRRALASEASEALLAVVIPVRLVHQFAATRAVIEPVLLALTSRLTIAVRFRPAHSSRPHR